MEEEYEIDPHDLLLENALRVVFRASEMLDSEELSPNDLKALSGSLREATEIILSIENSCSCGVEEEDMEEGEEGEGQEA